MTQFGTYKLIQNNVTPKEQYKILHRLHRVLFKEYLPLLASNRMTQASFYRLIKPLGSSYGDPLLDLTESIGVKVNLKR